jgi:hypothetical protein
MGLELPIDAKPREQVAEVDRMKSAEPLAADAVLIACPKCKAWPMAVSILKPSWSSRPMVQFTCPKCHFAPEAERR